MRFGPSIFHPELCDNRTDPYYTAAVPDEESLSQTRPQRTQSEAQRYLRCGPLHRFASEAVGSPGFCKNGDFAMKNVTLSLLAAAAVGAISIGSASAMPVNNLAGLGESHLQDVRLVCNRFGRCYNTYARRYYGRPGYYGQPGYYGYYGQPGYGYYGGPRVGVGIGPFGFGVW
jgi:hypothetical protein